MVRALSRAGIAAALVVTAALALTSAAQGYTAASGYTASDYASVFPADSHGIGPIGLVFDQSNRLYAIDSADGNLYSFPPGGGQVSPATRVSSSPISGGPVGAALTSDGRLYVTRGIAKDVVEVDPATGNVLRTVASGIQCPTGIAVDPVSGDLFVSQNLCGNTIFRISSFRTGPGTVTSYSSADNVDGIGFGNDGTLFAESAGKILAIAGTGTSHPGAVAQIGFVPRADGLAFGQPRGSMAVPFLVANRLDGTVTRIDFDAHGTPTNTDILSGGSRGDFVTVDSHGCLYVTQTDRIVRITANGTCNFTPVTPGPVQEVAASLVVGCSGRRLVLIDVLKRGGRVQLLGAADSSLVGHPVQIFFGPQHQQVATVTVGADGFFQTTAPLPPRSIRNTNRARYVAQSGNQTSLDLKLKRRMIVTSLTSAGGKVTLSGRVLPPLAKPRRPIRIQRRVTCSKYVTVKRVKPDRHGRFRATLAAPPRSQAAVYRAATFVRKNRTSRERFPTFTLPRVVEVK